MKLEKCKDNPVLAPNPDVYWENLVTCNPGVIYDNGVFYMLYRAAGDDEKHVIRFGLATSTDGVHFHRVSTEPVFWADNLGNSALAVTKDFKTFRRLGRLTSPVLDDRDVILFPEKVGGKFVMMHRPKEYLGEKYCGVEYPSIWLKFSDDLLEWENKEEHLLITGRKGTWEEKIGGGAPPILTDRGWLVIYHGVGDGGLSAYKAGALLLDKDNPLKVLARTPEPILEPEYPYETEGLYACCVFPTGNVVVDGTLYVYYGSADKYIGLATCRLDDLLDHLTQNCMI